MNPRNNNFLYIDEIQRDAELSDHLQAQTLRQALERRLSEGEGPFTVVFSGIHSVGSTAYEALVEAAQAAQAQGRTLEISHPPLRLVQMIEDEGHGDLFGLTSDSLEMRAGGAGVPDGVKHGLPIIVPASLSAIQVIRDVVVQLAREMGFSEVAVADIELCVGEAAVNAVRYGSPNGTYDRLTVRFFQEEDLIIIDIRDSGRGFDPAKVPQPSAEQLRENGLGIFLMRNLMDRVTFTHHEGTTVRLEKYLQPAESAAEFDPELPLLASSFSAGEN